MTYIGQLLYFPCCDVLQRGRQSTALCWSCEESLGIDYNETYGDYPINDAPYRGGGTFIQFSQVKSEYLRRSTP